MRGKVRDVAEEMRLPLLLVVTEHEDLLSGTALAPLLEDFAAGTFRLVCWTVMDAYMKAIPAGIDLVILDVGLLSPLYRELIEIFTAEAGLSVLVHLTDDRPEVVRHLDGQPLVRRLKKPASLHLIAETIRGLLAENSGR